MMENKNSNGENGVVIGKSRKERYGSFHARYMEQCRVRNCAPLPEIRKNNKNKVTLDFYGDKLAIIDWLLISEAIGCDQQLESMSIRLRKCLGPVLEELDTERKTKLYKEKPVIFAKFIFENLVDNISNCLRLNKHLTVLNLEGLPLNGSYVESIAKSLASNKSIKELSFARSNIYDDGCEVICNIVRYLNNIEKFNLSDTGLTTKGAEHVANMIKIQKINRYTDGWQLSLRYAEIDTSAIAGVHTFLLARNPQIGNEGLRMIAEVLKDDVLVRVVDMECCGLTDSAANLVLDCLSVNCYIKEFNIGGNVGISKFLLRKISDQLKREKEDDTRSTEELLRAFRKGEMDGVQLAKISKLTMQQLIDQLKTANEQLQLEKNLRAKAEGLNDKLTTQIRAYKSKMEHNFAATVPEGHSVIEKAVLEKIIAEHQEHKKQFNGELSADEENGHASEMPWLPIARHKRMDFHERQPVQFMTETPEVSVSPRKTAPASAPLQPNPLRKVKSEVKYVNASNNLFRQNEPKSDYGYGTESDAPQIETNIGDTLANEKLYKSPNENVTFNDCEVDGLSLSTFCCYSSDSISNNSRTLRCEEEEFLRQDLKIDLSNFQEKEYGQGEGLGKKLSPRSMFLGLCSQKKLN